MNKKRKIPKYLITPSEALDMHPKPSESHISDIATISFRYVAVGGTYCLSLCDRNEVRAYKDLLRRLTSTAWSNVLQSSTKNKSQKTGFHYEPFKDSDLRVARPGNLGEDLTISSIRASGKWRLYGAYCKGVYYVLWFDAKHSIARGG